MPKKVLFYMSSGTHNLHTHMVENCPEGFEHHFEEFAAHNPVKISSRIFPPLTNLTKEFTAKMQDCLSPAYNNLRILMNKPKIRTFISSDYDLIHSGQSLLKTNLPYVVGMEHATVFSGYNQYAFRRPGFVRNLEKILLDRNLKRIISWTEMSRKSLTNFVANKNVVDKVETVYLTVPSPKKARRTNPKFNFFFLGRLFYEKGGYETLLAFEKIMDKYDCTLTMVSGTLPEELKKKYTDSSKVLMFGRLPDEKLAELYSNSDVFVFPTHFDTVGLVILEAMSFGLPVISLDSSPTPELIRHGETGLLVKNYFSPFAPDSGYIEPTLEKLARRRIRECSSPPSWYVDGLSKAMERMILDDGMRRQCSKNALLETTEGKFSTKTWKSKMTRIYEESLRN